LFSSVPTPSQGGLEKVFCILKPSFNMGFLISNWYLEDFKGRFWNGSGSTGGVVAQGLCFLGRKGWKRLGEKIRGKDFKSDRVFFGAGLMWLFWPLLGRSGVF
jgi:hypothetical protein